MGLWSSLLLAASDAEALQTKVLFAVIGTLWTIIMGVVWHSYNNLSRKLDSLLDNQNDTFKTITELKFRVEDLEEWRREQRSS